MSDDNVTPIRPPQRDGVERMTGLCTDKAECKIAEGLRAENARIHAHAERQRRALERARDHLRAKPQCPECGAVDGASHDSTCDVQAALQWIGAALEGNEIRTHLPTQAESIAEQREVLESGNAVCTSRGAEAIAAERTRQMNEEQWTPSHDDAHGPGVLAQAAIAYAIIALFPNDPENAKQWWPWDASWWKPRDERRNLVRAGALIAAEIDRIDRTVHSGCTKPEGR